MNLASDNLITEEQVENGQREVPVGWVRHEGLACWLHPEYHASGEFEVKMHWDGKHFVDPRPPTLRPVT